MRSQDITKATRAGHVEDSEAHDLEFIWEAARRAVAAAPPLIPGSPRWNRLAASFAAIPDTPVVTERGDVTGPVTEGR